MAKTPWEVDDSLITPQLLDAVKHVESRGNVNAVSPAGARGPYQFMPATARQYGLKDPHDEPSARDAAARKLTDLTRMFNGNVDKALLAYNWGEGNVMKGGPMPREAQEYVGKVRMAEQKGKKAPEAAPWEVDDTAPWEVDDTKATPTRTAGEELKRQAGLTGRALINAVASPLTLGGNLIGKGLNAITGSDYFKPSTDLVDQYMTSAGVPEAERPIEKGVQDFARSFLPMAKAGQVAQATYQATQGPRLARVMAAAAPQAATGAAHEVAMDTTGDNTGAALRGAAIGAAGELIPRGVGEVLSRVLPSTEAMKAAMLRGINPTMGQGVDPRTIRGSIVKNLEDVSSFAPVSGLPLRRAQDASANQLLEQAVHTVDPSAPILDTAKETVNALRRSTKQAYREPLDTTVVRLTPSNVARMNDAVTSAGAANNLPPARVARLQAELDSALSGVSGTTTPARTIENIATDIANGGGGVAEVAARRGVARMLREGVDTATAQAGVPMDAVRRARAGSYMLKSGEAKGVSSSKLLDRINRNEEKVGRDLVPELRTLAESAQGIEPAKRAFGVSNPVRLLAEVGGGSLTGGLANLGLGAYGAVQHTALPKLLLGDTATRDALIKRLRNPAIMSYLLSQNEE